MELSARPVNKVISFILNFIPKNDDTNNLIKDLTEYRKELVYTAPELLICDYSWTPFLQILNNYINVFDEEWKRRLLRVINDEENIRTYYDNIDNNDNTTVATVESDYVFDDDFKKTIELG